MYHARSVEVAGTRGWERIVGDPGNFPTSAFRFYADAIFYGEAEPLGNSGIIY